jgi:hypothetical protein
MFDEYRSYALLEQRYAFRRIRSADQPNSGQAHKQR